MAPIGIGIGISPVLGGKAKGKGLNITLPASISFNDGDQPYNMAGAEKIVFADTGTGDTTYTADITIGGGGTITLTGLTGLTGSGNGTGTLSYSGTIAALNTALDGADIAGLSGETASITVILTGDTTSRTKTRTITVTSTTVAGVNGLQFNDADNSQYLPSLVA